MTEDSQTDHFSRGNIVESTHWTVLHRPFEPAPFNGELLQVMRWPFFKNMTDHELRAIYEYLGAVPCNPGKVIPGADYLQNVCE